MTATSPSHSPHLFRINAGSCNGCDVELAATAAVERYDVANLGCRYTEEPAEADIVLVTGPLTAKMREAVLILHAAVPEPKVTVAVGICPVSCGVFRDSYAVDGPVDRYLPIDVNIPGCPPRPQAILEGIADAVALWRQRVSAPPELPAHEDFREPSPDRLRGRPRFNASACVGCRMCAHVCAGGAIRFDEDAAGIHFTLWHNSCAFCGLCAHYCPTGALRLTGEWRMAHRQEEKYRLVESGTVPLQECGGCGEPFVPAAPELMRRAFRGSGADIEKLRMLCRECRLTLNLGGLKR